MFSVRLALTNRSARRSKFASFFEEDGSHVMCEGLSLDTAVSFVLDEALIGSSRNECATQFDFTDVDELIREEVSFISLSLRLRLFSLY